MLRGFYNTIMSYRVTAQKGVFMGLRTEHLAKRAYTTIKNNLYILRGRTY